MPVWGMLVCLNGICVCLYRECGFYGVGILMGGLSLWGVIGGDVV